MTYNFFRYKHEILFIIFLLSGLWKVILSYYKIHLPIDLTLFAAILMTIGIYQHIIKETKIFFSNKYLKIAFFSLVILFIWILFSVYYSSSNSYIYQKILRYLTIIISFLYPIIMMRSFSIKAFYKLFVFFTLITGIIFLPIFLVSYEQYMTTHIANGVYMAYLTMGYTTAIAIIIAIFNINKMYIKFLVIASLLLILITTGARGPLIFLVILFVIYFIYKYIIFAKINKNIFKYFIVILIVVSSLLVVIPSVPKVNTYIADTIDRTYDRLSALTDVKGDESANSRLVFIDFVIEKLDASSIMQGYGFGSFGIEHLHKDIRHYPHNIFLELLFELGVIGLFIFIIFIFSIIFKLFQLNKPFEWILFTFLILNSLKSLSLVDSRVMFGLFVIILLTNYQKEKELYVK